MSADRRNGTPLLVSAGEASGDWMAARVLDALGRRRPVAPFGLGGPAARSSGMEAVGRAEQTGVMGMTAPIGRTLCLGRAAVALVREARRQRPPAALLVGFSEFNARLGRHLRTMGTRVLWYAPPQIWAWRPGRARSLAACADAFSVLLPFEEILWQRAGAQAEWVGHPSFEAAATVVRRDGDPRTLMPLALLPGSRAAEVRRHFPTMARAAQALSNRFSATVVLARGLDAATSHDVIRMAGALGIAIAEDGLGALDRARLAVCASGTATLDCVARGVPPIIVYATDRLTYAAARTLARTAHVGLPNVALARSVFPELVQRRFNVASVAGAMMDARDRMDTFLAACREVRERLVPDDGPACPSARVAARLEAWLPAT